MFSADHGMGGPGNAGLDSSVRAAGKGRAGFHGHREDIYACLLHVAFSGVGPGQKAVLIADIRYHRHR